MKRTKQFLSLALVLIMAFSLLPATASAANDFVVKDGVLVRYNGNSANVSIPNNLGITAIGPTAFYVTHLKSTLASVVIPEGVVSIGDNAFLDCVKLTTVHLPSTLRTIGEYGFFGCPITDINQFPYGLESIGLRAFIGLKITKLDLPVTVKTIGEGAFSSTPLTSVSLPGVIEIGKSAFSSCPITEVSMPNVEVVGQDAFKGATTKTLTIGKNVTSLGNLRGVEKMIFLEGVTEITGKLFDSSFFDEKLLREVILPSTLKVIGESVFEGTSIESILLPPGLTTIGAWAFASTNISELRIPGTVTEYHGSAFRMCYNLIAVAYENGFSETITTEKSVKNYYIPMGVEKEEFSINTNIIQGEKGVTVYTPEGSPYDMHVEAWEEKYRTTYKGTLINADSPPESVFGPVYTKTSETDPTVPAPPTPPTPPAPSLVAKPTASTVLVNGEKVAFDAYNIGGNNYFKLRDLAYILSGTETQFEVGWDQANNAISLTSGQAYTAVGGEMEGKGSGDKTPTATSSKIYLDGKEVSFTAYNIEGNNYFKLRDVGEAFDFNVSWDGANNTIVIATNESYTAD